MNRSCFLMMLSIVAIQSTLEGMDLEAEPNDSRDLSTPIVPAQAMAAQLSSPTDQDWFGFSMSGPGTIRIDFDAPDDDFEPIVLTHTIQVWSGALGRRLSLDTGDDRTMYSHIASAGTHFIIVRKGPVHFSTGMYSLLLTKVDALAESEPNNQVQDATALLLGQNVHGQLMDKDDQDFYVFDAASPGVLNVVWSSPENHATQGYHTIQVHDALGALLSSFNTGRNLTFQTGLPRPGNYFLSVRDGPWSDTSTKDYYFLADFSGVRRIHELPIQIYPAVEIVWDSVPGESYYVDWSPNLAPGSWFPLSIELRGVGGEMSFLDSIRTEAVGYYRVRQLQ